MQYRPEPAADEAGSASEQHVYPTTVEHALSPGEGWHAIGVPAVAGVVSVSGPNISSCSGRPCALMVTSTAIGGKMKRGLTMREVAAAEPQGGAHPRPGPGARGVRAGGACRPPAARAGTRQRPRRARAARRRARPQGVRPPRPRRARPWTPARRPRCASWRCRWPRPPAPWRRSGWPRTMASSAATGSTSSRSRCPPRRRRRRFKAGVPCSGSPAAAPPRPGWAAPPSWCSSRGFPTRPSGKCWDGRRSPGCRTCVASRSGPRPPARAPRSRCSRRSAALDWSPSGTWRSSTCGRTPRAWPPC